MPDPYRPPGTEPATVLLHKLAGIDPLDARAMSAFLPPLKRLMPVIPLEAAAGGMQVLTQDPRLLSRLREDAGKLEQEFIVEVDGEIAPYGLNRLRHGLAFNGRNLPPINVSWQNEVRLRFALAGVQPGQLASMCADVGLAVVAMKRIRIGRVPLSKLEAGTWRFMSDAEKL